MEDLKNNISLVFMCGGSGERLWPLSSENYPKQFMEIDEKNLLEKTIERNIFITKKIKHCFNYFVTNEKYRFLTKNTISKFSKEFIKKTNILLEPFAKNTATTLTLAAIEAYENNPEAILVAIPTDQIIKDTKIYQKQILKAINYAESNHISLLGIPPKYKNNNFGYIKRKSIKSSFVEKFIEKPSLNTLDKIVKSNLFLWNSGIYILKASIWLNLLEKHQKKLFNSIINIAQEKKTDQMFTRYNSEKFSRLKKISIDYAVTEKFEDNNNNVRVLRIGNNWNDLGTVDSLKKEFKTTNTNINLSCGAIYNSKNNFISKSSKNIFLNNVNNLLVLQDDDNILISDSNKHNIRKILPKIFRHNRKRNNETSNKIYRPWGSYQTITIGENFKVKKLIIKSQSSISLQMHKYRSEHWVIVKGKATIINGDKKIILKTGESTFIPKKTAHRVTNDMSEDLIIIETQVGNYLKEDDIIRYEDLYGRT